MDATKVLLFDAEFEDSLGWAREALRKSFPNAEVTVLTSNPAVVQAVGFPDAIQRGRKLDEQKRVLRQAGAKNFHYSILPFRLRFLKRLRYWLNLLLLITAGTGTRRLLDIQGQLLDPIGTLVSQPPLVFLLGPFIAIVNIVRSPYYLFHNILWQFIMTPEPGDDEFTGHGAGKGAGGLVYWLTYAHKASRYGLFGLAHDVYMGVPLGVHTWPLATAALWKLGYRRYTCLSAILLGLGLTGLCLSSGHPLMLVLLPFIFCSNYFTFNIYVGVLELLAWAFGFLAFASLHFQLSPLAGLFLAMSLLIHPGVSFMLLLPLGVYEVLGRSPLTDILWMGVMAGAFTVWFIVPYRRCSDKLGREAIINQAYPGACRWPPETVYQFVVYAIFILSALLAGPRSIFDVVLLLLPLLCLVYNAQVKWTFSQYTVGNYAMFAGAIYLCLHPSPLPLALYLVLIYTSSKLLFGLSDSLWGFDLTPVSLGDTRRRIKEAFTGLEAGRVAFELGDVHAWYQVAALTYVLSDMKVDLLNGSYAEIGDARIFQRYCQHLNAQSTQEEFETACRDSGVKYVVAFSDEFTRLLAERGYKQLNSVADVNLSPYPNTQPMQQTLFELPWDVSVIEPPVDIQISPNEIKFPAMAGQTYQLKLSAFPGWRAFRNGQRITLTDAAPGIVIQPVADGEVTLRYAYRHYWS